jgi:hypothetical protein
MNPWLKNNIGGAVGVGLAWLLTGALIGLVIFEGIVDPDGRIEDIWPAVLGLPAFFGGLFFFTLVRLLERRRRLDEVSLPRATAWGAVSGPLVPGCLVLAMALGLGDWRDDQVPWSDLAFMTGLMIPAFAVAGWLTVKVARIVRPGLEGQ